MLRRLIYCLLFTLPVLSVGCLRDKIHSADTATFVLKVTDLTTGDDITDTEQVEDVVLMLFDENEGYVSRIDMGVDDLGQKIKLPDNILTRAGSTDGVFRVSAWGNLGKNSAFEEIVGTGKAIESQFLNLTPDSEYDGNWVNPGDMFFGMGTITLGKNGVQTLFLTQKTARMAVTVRGLPVSDDADYYFSMCEQNDGFTYTGTPLRTNQWCKIRENGIFNHIGDFVTIEPYYVIPSVDPTDAFACNAGVCVYRVGGGETTRAGDSMHSGVSAQELTSDQAGYITADGDMNITGKAKQDSAGNHLALEPGRTTNVLMEMDSEGDLEITIKMTDWDEVYQWSNWGK